MPWLLDLLIPLLFLVYGWMILNATSTGNDNLPNIRLASGELPMRLWQILAFTLLASSICDGLNMLDQIAGQGQWRLDNISVFSSANLLILGVVGMSRELIAPASLAESATVTIRNVSFPASSAIPAALASSAIPAAPASSAIPAAPASSAIPAAPAAYGLSDEDRKRDSAILSRLEHLLRDEQLYLDTDLTLTRLARRLSMPTKQVSVAINRQYGE